MYVHMVISDTHKKHSLQPTMALQKGLRKQSFIREVLYCTGTEYQSPLELFGDSLTEAMWKPGFLLFLIMTRIDPDVPPLLTWSLPAVMRRIVQK